VTHELYAWEASGAGQRSPRGVTDKHHRAHDDLAEALKAMPPGKAEGTIRRARLDLAPVQRRGYVYGAVVARARRDASGRIIVSCNQCTPRQAVVGESC
jgi:hypothetical protein